MNICFVLISKGWGGAENVVHQIISNMIKEDIKIFLILNDEMAAHFKDLDIKMLNLGSLYDSSSLIKMIIQNKTITTPNPKPIPILNMILMYTYFYRARKRINNFLKDIPIINSHLEYSDLMSYVVKKGSKNELKWVITIHGPWFSLFYDESRISSIKNKSVSSARRWMDAFKLSINWELSEGWASTNWIAAKESPASRASTARKASYRSAGCNPSSFTAP